MVKLPFDLTRCRDDACPMRWDCARYACPWAPHVDEGRISYIATLRNPGVDGCEFFVRTAPEIPNAKNGP